MNKDEIRIRQILANVPDYVLARQFSVASAGEATERLADALLKKGSIERKEISVEEIEDIIFSGANTIDINPESSLVLHQDQFLRVAKAIKDKLKGDKITKEDVQPLIDKIKNS